jgi:hypothetical protein
MALASIVMVWLWLKALAFALAAPALLPSYHSPAQGQAKKAIFLVHYAPNSRIVK